MLYTKNQPQSFFGSGEEDTQVFLPYMGMVAILFNGCKSIQTYYQYPFDKRPRMKSG